MLWCPRCNQGWRVPWLTGNWKKKIFKGARQTQHRRASLLSSPSYQWEQLFGVAPLVQETGYAVIAVFGRLLYWSCSDITERRPYISRQSTERAPDSMVSKLSVQLSADFKTFTIQVQHFLTTAGPVVSWKRVQEATGELQVRNFHRRHCIAILFLLSNSQQN